MAEQNLAEGTVSEKTAAATKADKSVKKGKKKGRGSRFLK